MSNKNSSGPSQGNLFFPSRPFMAKSTAKNDPGSSATVCFFGTKKEEEKALEAQLSEEFNEWQVKWLTRSKDALIHIHGRNGHLLLVRIYRLENVSSQPNSLINRATLTRNIIGTLVQKSEEAGISHLDLQFFEVKKEEIAAVFTGFELASYRYQKIANKKQDFLTFSVSEASQTQCLQGSLLGYAVNYARHLTNIPGSDLSPEKYSNFIQETFANSSSLKVDVIDTEQLEKMGCGLILGVGKAALEGPRIVHLSYRPAAEAMNKTHPWKKPLALVGKGITFDTGGLDMKPSIGMRRMKKDMGGSASVAGLAMWAEQAQYSQPLDMYLAIAENVVDAASYRPGDILRGMNGKTVEIHNTDAEGRLALADALCIAEKGWKDAKTPAAIINLATLTGAARVALGPEIGALYSTHKSLEDMIHHSALEIGDLLWPMPLYSDYRILLQSSVADFSNAAATPFAGSITAAIFLTQFVSSVPLAHMDIYAWTDERKGPFLEPGGSGQAVQAIAHFLRKIENLDITKEFS